MSGDELLYRCIRFIVDNLKKRSLVNNAFFENQYFRVTITVVEKNKLKVVE